MLSLSRTTWSRKSVSMVVDTAKLKNRKSTLHSTRGRDAAKELTLKGEQTLQRNSRSFFWETKSIVNRNSKLAGPSRSASRWTSWHRRITPTVYTKRNLRDIKDSGISHWTNRAKMRRCDFDQTFELQSQSRTVSIENQAKNVQNPLLTNNIGDGTLLPQAIPGGTGTRPKAGGAHEFNSFLKKVCCSRFRLRLIDSTPHTSLFLLHIARV